MPHRPVTRTPTRRRAAPLALAALLAAQGLAAQQAPAPAAGALTLQEALRAALAGNASVLLARQDVQLRQGALLSAQSAFAPQVGYGMTGSSKSNPLLPSAPAGTSTGERSMSSQATLSRRLRSGLQVQTGFNVLRTMQEAQQAVPVNSAGFSMGVVMPLLRDRWGSVTGATERASREDLEVGTRGLGQALSGSAYRTAAAYWNYVSAVRRLEVYRAAEQRAEQLASEIRTLIAADERPPADLNQTLANLASKRMNRLAAEQDLVTARQNMGRAMGLEPGEIAALPAPASAYPSPLPFAADAAAVERLQANAAAARLDLAGAAAQVREAEVLVGAARSTGRPKLDLTLSAGYTGVATGGGFGQYVAPLYRDLPGPNASVQVSFQAPATGTEAQGRVLQQRALAEQARVAERDLRQQIGAEVATDAQALERSLLKLEQAHQSASLYQIMLANERRKNQLGANTL
ncbi:MAG TPA: TolC family protein, partial [Longimicrobiaceae bacterium]|nr:TolC family protein [Longimicrobiaceae bacterium]